MEISPRELTRLLHQAYREGFSSGFENARLRMIDALPVAHEFNQEVLDSWNQSVTKTRSIPATFGSGAAL